MGHAAIGTALAGLLIYRGVARWVTGDRTLGFGSAYNDSLRLVATGVSLGGNVLQRTRCAYFRDPDVGACNKLT